MTKQQTFAVIPAAGMGKRMGASINKQYLMLDEKPILAHTLSVFQNCSAITGIVLVIPQDEISFCQAEIVDRYPLAKVLSIVPGGAERQHSVMNGLKALEGIAAADDVVLVHDGVRPFVTPELLEQVAMLAATGTGALVAVPAKDTIKVVQDGVVVTTPDRSTLWQAQTPQAFRYGQLLAAYEQASREAFVGTDDCSLVERQGGAIRVITGSYRNIKITTPEDLVLAEAFLAQRTGGTTP